MKLIYKLSNSDFLEHQLYVSSKSKSQNDKRFRSRIAVPLIYLGLVIYTYLTGGNSSFSICLFILAILWYLFYPKYSSWKYERHYRKHIEEHYKNRIGKASNFTFGETSVQVRSATVESTVDGSELKELIELKNRFFIKLSTDECLIVPKESIEDQSQFKRIITNYGAAYIDETEWKWE